MMATGAEAGSRSLPGPLVRRALLALIRFYRRVISPLKRTPTCRYLPTCSEYAMEAVQAHGAAKGSLLAAARILRCNPFFHAGYHPVPPSGRWGCCEHEGRH
jgi:putative membrane protein insertion efficiency factor